MEKIKVLHFPGAFKSGGLETVLFNLHKSINKNLFQFDYCVAREKDDFYDDKIIRLGGKIISIPLIRNVGVTTYIQSLKSIIKENGPYDVVHIHSIGYNGILSVIVSKILNIDKIIYHVHGTKDDKFENLKFSKIIILITSFLIRLLSDELLACSIEASEYAYRNTKLFSNKISILKNGVDTNEFKPFSTLEKIKLKESKKLGRKKIILGHAARFVEGKNQEVLIRLFSKLENKNMILLLAGNGKNKKSCIKLVKEMSLEESVLFCGLLQNKEMPIFYNLLDVFLFPSDYEGLGMSVIEAQACGIRCLVSDGVPKESDIGAGIWKQIDFNSKDFSSNLKCNKTNKNILKKEFIRKKVKESGYSLSDTVKKLEMIYN